MRLSQQPHRWVLFWMCVVIGVNQLGFGAVIPTLPLYAKSFGVSYSAIGAAIAIYGLARFLVAMPTGRLADWLGRRPTLAFGGIVSAAGNLWCGLADTYAEFLVARFVAGAGATLVLTTGIIVLADISSKEVRGRMMAIYQGVFLFSVGIGPLPGGMIASSFGLDAPFFAYALAGLIVGLVAWFAVTESKHLQRGDSDASAAPLPSFGDQLKLMVSQIGFLLVCVLGFTHAFVRTGGLFNIIPVLGAEMLHLSATQIGFAMAAGSVVGLAAAYPAGVLVDRFGRKSVIVPASVLTGASFLLFCFAPSFGWFMLATVAWGVASASGGAAPSAYAADSAPAGMNAAALSTYRMLADAGYVIGPLVLGMLVDGVGVTPTLIVAAFLMMGVALLFAKFAPETYAARRPQS